MYGNGFKIECMLLFVIFLSLMVISVWAGCTHITTPSLHEISLEVKDFSSPYYQIGVSFTAVEDVENGVIEEDLKLSLFFVAIVFTFVKEIN